MQSYPPHEEMREGQETAPAEQAALFNDAISDRIWQRVKQHGGAISWPVTERVVTEARGVAVPVSRRGISYEGFLASARLVENVLPDGANWDGGDGGEPVSAVAPSPSERGGH